MAQVTELVTKFSFAGSTAPLFNFNKGLSTSIKMSAAFSAALFAAGAAFTKWSSGVIQSLDPLAQMEKRTGVAIGRIQELGYIAGQSGSSIDAMMGSVLSLSQTIGDAAINGSEDFARLGISIRDANGQLKAADVILDEVGGRFKSLNLSMMEQESIAGSLGIDASLVQMLNRSSGELAELSKQAREYGTLTKEQGEQIIAYNDALNRQKFAISAVKQQIAVGFAPTLTDLTDKFTKLIAENKDWITNTASKTIEISVEVMDAFKNIGGAIFDFADAISMGNGKLTLLIGALAGAAAAFPVTAAIIAVTLAVEDLITAFNGGESVIADFFEDNFGIDIVQKIKDFNDLISETVDAVKFLTGSSDYTPAQLSTQLTQQYDELPLGYGQSGTQIIDRTITQDVDININTNDPNAAGRAVRENLKDQLNNAETQTNLGGM